MGELIPISRPFIGDEEKAAVLEVLDSGMLVQGPRVAAFEEAFAAVAGVRHAVAVASGTWALHLALAAHGIGPGDEVITSSFTFVASVNSIIYVGATPVFADIEESTFNLDPDSVEAAITSRTRALMPVHLYGQPCDMDRFQKIAQRHGLVLLEDAAQAVGARYHSRPAGSFGTAAFSLYATKNLTTAEGGMITTDDDLLADRLRLLRNHGMRRRYHHETLGWNARLTDIAAAIGLVQMGRLDDLTQRRRANAARLSAGIRSVITPAEAPDREHVWHQYTVRVPDGRDRAVEKLSAAGVGTAVFYPIPAHRFEHVREFTGEHRDLPVTDRLSREVLSLPVHPQLTGEDLDRIIFEVNQL